jgi:hypothetical protein
VLVRDRERDAAPFVTKDGSTIRESLHTGVQSLAEASLEPGSWHELTAGDSGVRLLCSCVPPYSDEDSYFA